MSKGFTHPSNEPGFIIGWKYKYEFKTGKYADEVMTYGEALKRVDELQQKHPEMTFWPEKAKDDLANRFFNPQAH